MTDPQRDTTTLAVLGLVALQPGSGYDLARLADRSVGYLWTPSRSQIYKVLPRLVSDGLATAKRPGNRHRSTQLRSATGDRLGVQTDQSLRVLATPHCLTWTCGLALGGTRPPAALVAGHTSSRQRMGPLLRSELRTVASSGVGLMARGRTVSF